jgi:hypothetical protein
MIDRPFDRVIIADWSASGQLSPRKPSPDAIWIGMADATGCQTRYFRGRAEAEAFLQTEIAQNPQRLLIGFDFPMGYPAGFASALTGQPAAKAVWRWIAARLEDGADNRNNRFEVAAQMNRAFAGLGPFWGRPPTLILPDLPEKKLADYAALGFAERRLVETVLPRAQAVWKLYTTGAAGSQGLVGQPMIERLSRADDVAVWPFDPANRRVVLAEVYPSLLATAVAADTSLIKDEAQVRLLAKALWQVSKTGQLASFFAPLPPAATTEEGWILGAEQAPLLAAALGQAGSA